MDIYSRRILNFIYILSISLSSNCHDGQNNDGAIDEILGGGSIISKRQQGLYKFFRNWQIYFSYFPAV